MKKVLGYIFGIVIVVGIIVVTVFLGIKIHNDTNDIKMYEEESEKELFEASQYIDTISTNFENIKRAIEEDIGEEVLLADSGTITKIELYFVANVNGEYRYIVDKNEDGVQKFSISDDEFKEARYYITPNDLGLKDTHYSDINKYSITRDGKVEYGK